MLFRVNGLMGDGPGKAPPLYLTKGADLAIELGFIDDDGTETSGTSTSVDLYFWARGKYNALDISDTDESFTSAAGTNPLTITVADTANDLSVGKYRYGVYYTESGTGYVFAAIGWAYVT